MKKQITSTDSPAVLAHKLWDEIFKSIIRRMPEQLLPLISHVFHRDYPKTAHIELLSTEYPVPKKTAPKELTSVFADIALRIAHTDVYHMECQMEKQDAISIRMVEYDTHIAILYGSENNRKDEAHTLHYPYSIIIYLESNDTIPKHSLCRMHFPNGTETLYSIPVVKVQDYTLQDIQNHHLSIFLPFVLLRFRPRLKAKRNKLTKNELTMFVNEIILILNNELQEKYITQRQYKDYMNYIRMAADQIFIHHPKFHKEVLNMLIPTVFSYSEVEEQIEARTTARVTAKFKSILQEEKEKWTLEIQQKESEIAALRTALEANGIDVDELLAQNS